MAEKIVIIGAGIAGLTAGCYLQMNGYDTSIFELHNQPGGLCTSWKRNNYTFDGCVHWLVGSTPNDPFYKLWNEIIDLSKIKFVDHDIYFRVEDKDGKFLNIYTNIEKLENEFFTKAPEDEVEIREFFKAIRKLSSFDTNPSQSPYTQTTFQKLGYIFKTLPYMKTLMKYLNITLEDYSKKFSNPLLSRAFREMFVPGMSVVFSMFTIIWMDRKSAGYPIGGSLSFAKLFEEKYLELGGKIRYHSKVEKILTENKSATGIVLANGEKHSANRVISAADGHYTIYNMLDLKYTDSQSDELYTKQETFSSLIQVSLGIKKTFKQESNFCGYILEKPIMIDPATQTDVIGFHFYSYDPSLAPEGSTVVTIVFPTDNYNYWVYLRNEDKEKYKAEKERIKQEAIRIFEQKFGAISSLIEESDVTTPATYIRYTNNWKGSFEGWILNPRIGFKQLSKQIKGLKNFYMAGQWVEPGGGLPSALTSGRNVTHLICKEDGKKFKTLGK